MVSDLEFWPDYDGGPLWDAAGVTVDVSSLVLPAELEQELGHWNALYDDSKLPIGENKDEAWLEQGRVLLRQLRESLSGRYRVLATEEWWSDSD
jgi:hypothetical protein